MLPGQDEYSHIFQKLFHLRIILRFNLLLIQKLFLPTLMLGILEPMVIKCVFPLIPPDIVDNHLLSYGGALVGVWLSVGLVLELEVIFIWERETHPT